MPDVAQHFQNLERENSPCNREQSATHAHIWNKTVYSHLEKRTNKKNVGIFLRRIRLRHWF